MTILPITFVSFMKQNYSKIYLENDLGPHFCRSTKFLLVQCKYRVNAHAVLSISNTLYTFVSEVIIKNVCGKQNS